MTTDTYEFECQGDWEQKVWGEVLHTFKSTDVAVSVLKLNKGFRCSRHWHRCRANRFMVISGVVQIWVWRTEEAARESPDVPDDVLWMTAGSIQNVPAGIPHMFRVLKSGTMVEVYVRDGGDVDEDDIVRIDEGGPMP